MRHLISAAAIAVMLASAAHAQAFNPLTPVSPSGALTITSGNTWQTFLGAGQITHGCWIANYNASATLCVGWPTVNQAGVSTTPTGSCTCPGTSGGSQISYLPAGGGVSCSGPYAGAVAVCSATSGAGIWGGAN